MEDVDQHPENVPEVKEQDIGWPLVHNNYIKTLFVVAIFLGYIVYVHIDV